MTPMLAVGMWLAAYRLTRFVTRDTLIERPRHWFFLRFPPDSDYTTMERAQTPEGVTYWRQSPAPLRPISKLGELFDCPWCFGFWVCGVVVGVVQQFLSIPLPVLWWLALSSAVGLTARNLDG